MTEGLGLAIFILSVASIVNTLGVVIAIAKARREIADVRYDLARSEAKGDLALAQIRGLRDGIATALSVGRSKP